MRGSVRDGRRGAGRPWGRTHAKRKREGFCSQIIKNFKMVAAEYSAKPGALGAVYALHAHEARPVFGLSPAGNCEMV